MGSWRLKPLDEGLLYYDRYDFARKANVEAARHAMAPTFWVLTGVLYAPALEVMFVQSKPLEG